VIHRNNHLDTPPTLYRYRIHYAKNEAIRYVGHLDLHHAWERSLRRARLPLAYSRGFHPQARIQIACALPLGFTSQCEVLDLWLEQDFPLADLQQAIDCSVPPGLEIDTVEAVELKSPPLQMLVQSAVYQITLLEAVDAEAIEAQVQTLLDAASLPRERRGKTYDLRPLIEALAVVQDSLDPPKVVLHMQLSAREGVTGRPEEVLTALDIDPLAARVRRINLIY
jgi:radical SAM-linked protein